MKREPGRRPGRRRWRRTSWTRARRTRPADARPGTSSRAGSAPRPARGANATTRSASKNATPKVVQDRRVEFRPDSDGMAWFSAYLPADTAAGIWDRTTAAARALQGPDEPRTLTQLRADVAATLLLTTRQTPTGSRRRLATALAGVCRSPRAQVLVTVPVMSLLGAAEEPAVLDGYGPIPPSMARGLVADGADSFHRVLTDPRDGAPLEIGRTGYRLTKAMRRWLRLRDGRVPVPGLQQPLPGQRGRPSPGLGRRRHHRDHQPRPALPQAPPAETRLGLDTGRGQQDTTHPAGPHPRGGTTPANTRTGNHPTGHLNFWLRTHSRTQA